jgi:hypothetical protein
MLFIMFFLTVRMGLAIKLYSILASHKRYKLQQFILLIRYCQAIFQVVFELSLNSLTSVRSAGSSTNGAV